MIRKDELSRLPAEGEADRIERTISVTNTDKFSEAVTAFANDMPNHRLPGYLVAIFMADTSPTRRTRRSV
jgi:ATP-dependent DNA helicase RecG